MTVAQSHFDAIVAMLCREIGICAAPDDDLRRLASSLIALAVDFLTSADWIRQIAPRLHAGPEAIDRMSERLTGYAVAMLAYERDRARRRLRHGAGACDLIRAAPPRVLARAQMPGAALARGGCRCVAGGCAIAVPDPTPPAPAAAAWQAPLPHEGSAALLAQWWQRFDDPALAQLIDTAQRDNPGTRRIAGAHRPGPRDGPGGGRDAGCRRWTRTAR